MSIILRNYCYFILQITLLLAILLLLRGHNYPGGGFIAALIAATGIGFYLIAYQQAPPFMVNQHALLIGSGMACLVLSLLMPVISQKALLTGLWLKITVMGDVIKIGTPLLFDVGIFFAILGSLVWVMTSLEKEIDD